MTKISLVRTSNRTEGVRKAVNLLEINPVSGKSVVLKPNFNTADPAPGSTHNDTLRSLILVLKEMGAESITLAERSGPGDTTHRIMETKGVLHMAKELGFDIVVGDIKKGEEATYDYRDFYDDVKMPCNCGEENCC